MDEWAYLIEVLRTYAGDDTPESKLCLGALGLAGETGEVVDVIKKALFAGHQIDADHMRRELGDVLWYYMLICHVFHFSLEEIMQENVRKLRQRYPHGFESQRSIERGGE